MSATPTATPQINARLDAYEALAIAHLDPHPPNRLAERTRARLFG